MILNLLTNHIKKRPVIIFKKNAAQINNGKRNEFVLITNKKKCGIIVFLKWKF